MFQFPGFAFITLCIQVINTWLTALLTTLAGNNNTVSGGFPHSEIHGSKPILGSSWLIAEYHVFHRLLLPRHSPNALFALDLIQKKQDLLPVRHGLQKLEQLSALILRSKAYFPVLFYVLPPGGLLEDCLCPTARRATRGLHVGEASRTRVQWMLN